MNTHKKMTSAVMITAMLLSSVMMPCRDAFLAKPVTAFAAEAESCATAANEAVEENGFVFALYDDYAVITSYTGEGGVVQIPTECSGKPVTQIGNNAFKGTAITEADIPETVTKIGSSAFSGCSKLTKITLHEGLIEIGYHAFASMPITEIYIPSTLTSVDYPFYSCDSLATINWSKDITAIPNSLFAACGGLTEVDIPETVKKIGSSAFSGCSKLTKMNIN